MAWGEKPKGQQRAGNDGEYSFPHHPVLPLLKMMVFQSQELFSGSVWLLNRKPNIVPLSAPQRRKKRHDPAANEKAPGKRSWCCSSSTLG
jgi:hypothetical protein